MTDVQIGRILRALRLRKRLRQIDVAAATGVSQSTISLVERGHCDRLAISALRRVFAGVEARLELIATWRGAEIDRLIDEDHARLVAVIVGLLRRFGWITEVEVTYSRYRERGSIDVFAGHEVSRSVLVVEVKTAIGGIEATGRKLDEKTRLAAVLAEDRFGWRPRAVGRLLVLPATTTARRQVRRHTAVVHALVPDRGVAIKAWLRRPAGALRGLLFVADTNGRGVRSNRVTRVRRPDGLGPSAHAQIGSRRTSHGGSAAGTTPETAFNTTAVRS